MDLVVHTSRLCTSIDVPTLHTFAASPSTQGTQILGDAKGVAYSVRSLQPSLQPDANPSIGSSLYNAKGAVKGCVVAYCCLAFPKKKKKKGGNKRLGRLLPAFSLGIPFVISLVWYLCGLSDHWIILTLLVQACRRPLPLSVPSVLHIHSLLISSHAWQPRPCSPSRNAWTVA